MAGTTDIALHLVQTLDEAFELKRWLGERRPGGWLSVDTESTGLDWWRDDLRTVQFGDRHNGWCVEWSEWAGLVKELTEAYNDPIAYWNVKFDIHFLEHNGVKVKRHLAHDGRAMAHLQDPAHLTGLKPKSKEKLGAWAGYGEAELKEAMMRGRWDWATVPIEVLWQYAAFDTVITAQTCSELWPGIAANYQGIYDLELASTMVLADMERRGILTDRKWLVEHSDEWRSEADRLAVDLRQWKIGNPASNKQVIEALQRETGWTPIVFTDKGGVSLERDVLKGIDHPIAKLVQQYRDNRKLEGYVAQHLDLAGPDGRLHCSINPLGARTGRTSASRPNLQNLPADDKRIRLGFVASPGNVLISADFDQIEGRLFAHYSGDQNMLNSIRYGDQMKAQGHRGYDMHSMAARMIFNIGVGQDVPKPHRDKAKTGQFSKIYGVGLETFCARNGMTLAEGAAFFSAYEAEFPETRKSGGFQGRVTQRLIERERSEGEAYLLTAYGRKEPCWPSQAYKGLNYLIQGTAADVQKAKTVALSKTWVGEHMLLTIHDELIFEVSEAAAYDAVQVIREVMPEREKFSVPLTVDVEVMRRWGGELLALPSAA